jgi:hypothetical protein
MLPPDFLKDLHDIGVWLGILVLTFLGGVVRTIFTNKAQIELLKKELSDRFKSREQHDQEMKISIEKLEQTINYTREQILELWKKQ